MKLVPKIKDVWAGRVQIGRELADAEPEADQRERGADPCHQRPFRGLAIAFPREFVGDVGDDGLVGHRRIASLDWATMVAKTINVPHPLAKRDLRSASAFGPQAK